MKLQIVIQTYWDQLYKELGKEKTSSINACTFISASPFILSYVIVDLRYVLILQRVLKDCSASRSHRQYHYMY